LIVADPVRRGSKMLSKLSKSTYPTLGILVLIIFGLVIGCAKKEVAKKEGPKLKPKVATLKRGILQMGSDTTYPPFENGQGKKIVGFDVDLARAIARKLNLRLEVRSTSWNEIIPALKAKKFDIAMSAIPITEERAKEIDFSESYIDADQSIAVKRDSEIATEEDLAGKVVGVQVDTTGQLTAERIQGIKEIKKYDTVLDAFDDLLAGRIDAVINDFPLSAWIVKGKSDLKMGGKIFTGEKYGIAFRKDDVTLRKAVDKTLDELKEDGTYQKIFEKWFGKQE